MQFVIDPLYRKVNGELIPMRSLVSVDIGAGGDIFADQRNASGLRRGNSCQCTAFTLAHSNDYLAFAGLIDLAAAIRAL